MKPLSQESYVSHNVLINGLEVKARYSQKTVGEILIPLLRHLTKLQKEKLRQL